MNWGLVTLYYLDLFDKKAFDTLNMGNEKTMVELRGFQHRNKKPCQTVADLYPAIIEWTAK